jgi:hypothetical protein
MKWTSEDLTAEQWQALARAFLDHLRTLTDRSAGRLERAAPYARVGGKAGVAAGGRPGAAHSGLGVLGTLGAHSGGLSAIGGAAAVAGGAIPGVGIALSAFNAALNGRAAYSTHNHCIALEKLDQMSTSLTSWPAWGTTQATRVALLYALSQKGEKRVRRTVAAVPGLSAVGAIYNLGRAAYKSAKGTRGVERGRYAQFLIDRYVASGDLLAGAVLLELVEVNAFIGAAQLGGQQLHDLVVKKLASN